MNTTIKTQTGCKTHSNTKCHSGCKTHNTNQIYNYPTTHFPLEAKKPTLYVQSNVTIKAGDEIIVNKEKYKIKRVLRCEKTMIDVVLDEKQPHYTNDTRYYVLETDKFGKNITWGKTYDQ